MILNKINRQDLILSALTGILLVFSFPKWDQEWLAWIAFIPLFIALEKKRPREAFYLGYISGFIFFFGSLHWIIRTIVTYGKISWLTGSSAFLLMTLILSVYTGVFALGIALCSGALRFPRAVYIPILWTALEFARAHFFIPFPWVSLGYSQYHQLPLIQIADFTSVYGVSFFILLVNSILYELTAVFFFHGREDKPLVQFSWKPLVMTGFTGIVLLAYGSIRLVAPSVPGKTVRVSVVQGDIDQDKKWDERYRNDTLNEYMRLSEEAARDKPDLIIWPETAIPFLYEREFQYREELSRYINTRHIPFLIGGPTVTYSAGSQEWFNSAYFLNPDGVLLDRYDKINLVPFGEYVPFQSLLFFVNKLTEGIGDFKSGRRHTVFGLPGRPFGTLICFEVIFPELFRQFVKEGAVFMTTITNDAWFGKSSAPFQHFSMVVFRAIENRVPVARAANTGISGFIDSRGRILERTALFVTDQRTRDLAYYEEKTFYTRYGDIFGWLVFAAGISLFGLAFYHSKQKRKSS